MMGSVFTSNRRSELTYTPTLRQALNEGDASSLCVTIWPGSVGRSEHGPQRLRVGKLTLTQPHVHREVTENSLHRFPNGRLLRPEEHGRGRLGGEAFVSPRGARSRTLSRRRAWVGLTPLGATASGEKFRSQKERETSAEQESPVQTETRARAVQTRVVESSDTTKRTAKELTAAKHHRAQKESLVWTERRSGVSKVLRDE